MLWALINPLTITAVWLFFNGSKVVQVAARTVPYPVFVFTGTLLWSILIDALNAPLQVVSANKALLAKINFPREALIVSGMDPDAFQRRHQARHPAWPQSSADVEIRNDELWVVKDISIDCAAGLAMMKRLIFHIGWL